MNLITATRPVLGIKWWLHCLRHTLADCNGELWVGQQCGQVFDLTCSSKNWIRFHGAWEPLGNLAQPSSHQARFACTPTSGRLKPGYSCRASKWVLMSPQACIFSDQLDCRCKCCCVHLLTWIWVWCVVHQLIWYQDQEDRTYPGIGLLTAYWAIGIPVIGSICSSARTAVVRSLCCTRLRFGDADMIKPLPRQVDIRVFNIEIDVWFAIQRKLLCMYGAIAVQQKSRRMGEGEELWSIRHVIIDRRCCCHWQCQ